MHTLRRFWASLPAALLIALLLLPASASAHERRTIANGKYDVVVGWDVEPALLGQKNAAAIRISTAGTNPPEPVAGAEKTLKLQVRQGATTREFPLRAVFGQPGYYVADLLPTRTGDYQFAFTGSIGEDAVNERFDSADGKFDSVRPINDIQFPVAQSDAAQALAAAQSAQADAQSARTIGVAGIALGVLGLLVGGAAWATRPHATARAGRPAEQA